MHPQVKNHIACHRGIVGSAIVLALQKQDQTNLITRIHAVLDFTNQVGVNDLFAQEKSERFFGRNEK